MKPNPSQLGSRVTVVQGVIFVFCMLVFRRCIIGVIGSYDAGGRNRRGILPAAAERPAEARTAAAPGAP